MLNFKKSNIILVCLLILLAFADVKYGIPFYYYLLPVFLYSLIVFYGCIQVQSGFFMHIHCASETDKKEIAISFDDGPSNEFSIDILKLLQKENVKAAFFCIGEKIMGNEHIIENIIGDGHLIGNHSHTHHFWFDLFSVDKMLEDLQQMDQAVSSVTNLKPKLFRPPYGVMNPNLKKAIQRGGYTPVGWSVRSMDTVIKDEKKLLKKISEKIAPGAVFIFHDTCKVTLQVLPEFIQEVKSRGYTIVPLDKLLHLEPYA